MHLLFKALYLHCTCLHQLKLHQDCLRDTVVYLFNVIYCYANLDSKDKAFSKIGRGTCADLKKHHLE